LTQHDFVLSRTRHGDDRETRRGLPLEEHFEHHGNRSLRNPESPEQLIRREDHFDDTSRAHMRQIERQALHVLEQDEVLPREAMLQSVVAQDKHRPTPQQWQMRGHTNN